MNSSSVGKAGQYPRLSDPNYLLLLDTRQRLDYNESHIITAKFAPRNDIGAFTVPPDAELQTKEHVIVYDSNTSSIKDKSGYEEFSALYPFLRTQKIIYMPRELDVINTYPVEIIPGFLYVATIFQQSQDHRIIKDLKVKANVIVAKENDTVSPDRSDPLNLEGFGQLFPTFENWFIDKYGRRRGEGKASAKKKTENLLNHNKNRRTKTPASQADKQLKVKPVTTQGQVKREVQVANHEVTSHKVSHKSQVKRRKP
ncbi:hypothetical protein ACROYT_G009406 [Oculina patagonica]